MNTQTDHELHMILWTLKSAYDFAKFMQNRRVSPEVEQFSAYMEKQIGKALAHTETLIESACHTGDVENLPF